MLLTIVGRLVDDVGKELVRVGEDELQSRELLVELDDELLQLGVEGPGNSVVLLVALAGVADDPLGGEAAHGREPREVHLPAAELVHAADGCLGEPQQVGLVLSHAVLHPPLRQVVVVLDEVVGADAPDVERFADDLLRRRLALGDLQPVRVLLEVGQLLIQCDHGLPAGRRPFFDQTCRPFSITDGSIEEK